MVACLVQLANVIAPIMTEPAGPAWRQPTFHPFAITSRLAAGKVLRVRSDSPLLDTARFGEVPSVDAVATYDEETGKLGAFLVNRSVDGPIEVTLDTSRAPVTGVLEALGVHDADRLAVNTADRPDRVAPHPDDSVLVEDGRVAITLPPVDRAEPVHPLKLSTSKPVVAGTTPGCQP